ncbi:unnamed protein product [Auanema sp. JU1783]|nr:unnamed protein product [Auanema sp. JU1783]
MTDKDMSIEFSTPDGGNKKVPRHMAEYSLMVKRMVELYCQDGPLTEAIPLLKLNSSTLNCLVDWMTKKANNNDASNSSRSRESHHISDERYDGDNRLQDWERNFFVNLPRKQLFQLMNAANYMEIPSLVESGSCFISERISGLDLDQIRSYMNLRSDFNDEEENSLKQKYDWLNV